MLQKFVWTTGVLDSAIGSDPRIFEGDARGVDHWELAVLDGNGLRADDIPKAFTPGCGYERFPLPLLAERREPLGPDSASLGAGRPGLEPMQEDALFAQQPERRTRAERGRRSRGRRRLRDGLLAGFLAALGACSASADLDWDAESGASWLEREHLTGDWAGLRNQLSERGWEPFATYIGGVLGNTRGGRERGARYEGLASWGMDIDLERSVGWQGARFHLQWNSYHGGKPTESLVGGSATQDVGSWEAERSVRFYTIYLEQRALSDALRIKVGQLAIDDDFFLSEWSGSLLNSSFGDFVQLTDQTPAPIYPIAGPGLLVEVEPGDGGFFARAGLYAANVGEDEKSNFGFDWSLGSGIEGAIIAETGVAFAPFDLPGRFTIGSGGVTSKQTDFESGREVHGLHLFYAILDQVLVGDPSAGTAVGVFARAAWTPIEERAVVEWLIDGGVVWELGWFGRPSDRIGVGFAYHDFGRDFVRYQRSKGERARPDQTVVELSYRAGLAGWLEFQPSLQWVIDPTAADRDAWVLGAQFRLQL